MSDSGERFVTRGRVIALAALALAAAGIFFVVRRHGGAGTLEYITAPVERGSIRNVVSATGTVQALLTVQVGSQVTGQVQALYADYNSMVRQGQLLAKIDPRRFQAEVSGAEANLLAAQARVQSLEADLNSQIAGRASARANVESARVTRDNAAQIFTRNEALRQQGILSQNDYDNAKANRDSTEARHAQALAQVEQVEAQISAARAQIEQARAQVAQAQAALNQSKVNLEYTDIRSPVDGVVISRNVDVGQTVAASLQAPTLFLIAGDLAQMQLRASVDEADIGSISGAEQVRFTVDAFPSRSFLGRISEIRLEPLAVQNVVTYSVIVSVDNSRLELKPGMTANMNFTVAEKVDVLRIPNAALRYAPPGATRELEMAETSESVSKMNREPPPGVTRGPGKDADAETRTSSAKLRGAARKEAELSAPLAPGQLWKPGEKIQFPPPAAHRMRPGRVWIVNQRGRPEQRSVELGITDGAATEVVSGALQQGEAVIVGDSSQAASVSSGPFGFGPGH